jgi:hypothetical protein
MTTPPRWLDRLANAAAAELLTLDVTTDVTASTGLAATSLAPIGCHFHLADEGWEVALFVSTTEIVGGPQDGETTASPFAVDVERLRDLFDAVQAIHWQAQPFGEDDELGAHLAIEGILEGHEVTLRILSAPPARFEPGRTADFHQNRLSDRW